MKHTLFNMALGKNHYATLFLVAYMVVAPTAFFTDYIWLDYVCWVMTIILGLFIFITGWVTLQDAKQSHQWPVAQGKWLSGSLRQHSSNGSIKYAPNIRVAFKVAANEYEGTQYDFSASYERKELAQKKLEEVKNMHPLWVRYKPDDPTTNVIHPGVHLVHIIRLILGLAAMVIPILVLLGFIQF